MNFKSINFYEFKIDSFFKKSMYLYTQKNTPSFSKIATSTEQ